MNKIIRHQVQIDAFNDDSRFKFILAGRRGGKTFLIVEDILKTINQLPPYGELIYIGPSLIQAKELIWEPLDRRMRQLKWNYSPYISKSRFELSRHRKIYILGAEKIRRVRGHKYYKAYLDEIAFFSTPISEVWMAIRPALSDARGGAIVSTTPNGKGTDAYDFYLSTLNIPGWKYFHWRTLDNPFLDPVEIENAKKELDEKSFKQEYEAEWQSFEGLAYYNFDENVHIVKQPEITAELPLHLCFDFNVNPTTLLLSQPHEGMLRYKKEYSFKNSSTESTVEAFCLDFLNKREHLKLNIRGDATGSSRSANTGRSDYYYVQQILTKYGFRYNYEVASSNPPIVDRLKTVNGWLKPVVGSHRVEIDPSCKELIRDLSSQALDGRKPSDSNNLGHKADAFGYDIYYENLLHRKVKQATILL